MRLAVVTAVAFALAGAACSGKAESRGGAAAAVSGMAAVPASARVVVTFDVDRLATSPVVARAAAQLVSRSPDLGARIERLSRDCNIDVTRQVRRVILALGDPAKGEVLLVATGTFTESDLAQCLTRVVGAGGGSVSGRLVGGRTLYAIKESARTMYFAFGQADTVVIGTLEPLVIEAIGAGKKVADVAEMKTLLDRVDPRSPIWAAGLVDEVVAQGLVRASQGKIKRGAQAVFGTMDPTDGLRAELGAVLASEDDAKAMETLVTPQLGLLAVAAQVKGLGPVVGKITTRRDGSVVRFGLVLTESELNQVLKAIDMGVPASQDAPPAASATVPDADAGSSGD